MQERVDLETNEIIVGKTKVLRDTDNARLANENASAARRSDWQQHTISYHTHRHCPTAPGAGEFVFIGRLRFNEIMLVCAPRLEEWANIVYKYEQKNAAPCILIS